MNNVYFGKNGISSTEMNHLCNIAKESYQQTEAKINGISFYEKSVSAIGSSVKQVMMLGTKDISFLDDALSEISELKAFCAWGREAIKEKDSQLKALESKNIEEWITEQGISRVEKPSYPVEVEAITEEDVVNSWDINKRNKYLKLEAYAATIGKYIHPNGAFNIAREALHNALGTPITKEGSGRDMILFYKTSTIAPCEVENEFMRLQELHRSYEKQLNYLKAEIKEVVNKKNSEIADKRQEELDQYSELSDNYYKWYQEMRNAFNKWKISEKERISQLKIVIPTELNSVYSKLK